VVTEFKDKDAMAAAARKAANEFGYTRMWSIHPNQIRPILEAFAPMRHKSRLLHKSLQKPQGADWAPITN
jgi:citrate lyase subunit beta/citryl-CoA lyase